MFPKACWTPSRVPKGSQRRYSKKSDFSSVLKHRKKLISGDSVCIFRLQMKFYITSHLMLICCAVLQCLLRQFISMLALAMDETHPALSHLSPANTLLKLSVTTLLQTSWDEVQEGSVYRDMQEARQPSPSSKNLYLWKALNKYKLRFLCRSSIMINSFACNTPTKCFPCLLFLS